MRRDTAKHCLPLRSGRGGFSAQMVGGDDLRQAKYAGECGVMEDFIQRVMVITDYLCMFTGLFCMLLWCTTVKAILQLLM